MRRGQPGERRTASAEAVARVAARREDGKAPVAAATWHAAPAIGDGLAHTFPPGTLKQADWLWADALLDGDDLAVFELQLREGADGPAFSMTFGLVNQAQRGSPCRWRRRSKPLAVPAVGPFLKPLCGGDRVDLARVDRMVLRVHLKGPEPRGGA